MKRCEYANGKILFAKELTYEEYRVLEGKLQICNFFVDKVKSVTNSYGTSVSCVDFSLLDNDYYCDETERVLNDITHIAPIESGAIEYVGDDCKHWRYIYRGYWVYQKGRVVYEAE